MEPERICRKDLIPATGTFQRSERAASYFEEGKEAEFVSAGELVKSEALPPARIIATHRARATGGVFGLHPQGPHEECHGSHWVNEILILSSEFPPVGGIATFATSS